MNICTIIAKNYVAHARVLAESFKEHHPDGTCFTLVIDEFTPDQIDPANEPFTVVSPSDLDLTSEDFDDMRARYNVLEFSTAVKPWLLRHMLDAHDDGSGVAYFDPDIRVYSRMLELEEALSVSSIVLTPHLTKPLPRDGRKPSETDIMIAGIYNLGFIGLSAGADTDALLEFWEERLRHDCWVAPERGLFVDQKWIDWVPGLLTDLTILREPAYNVAYWNVPTRTINTNGSGYLVDERPLRFFHYSGYSPDRPADFSKHQDRVRLVPGTPLMQLCEDYGARLLANRFEDVRRFPYDHDRLPSGEPLDVFARSLYRQAADAGAISDSIFSPNGEIDFIAWSNQDSAQAPGLTRYLREIWTQRDDLQRAYPDPEGHDREGYLGWCEAFGREQIPISSRMLAHLGNVPAPQPVNDDAPTATAVEPVEAEQLDAAVLPREFGVNVAGYLRSELGIAEVARQVIRAFDTVGIPSFPRSLNAPGSRQGHPFVTGGTHPGPHPVNLIFVNADGLPGFAEEVGPSYFEGRYSIGFWWWELPTFPEAYHGAFDLVDEVWVGSKFVADALRAYSPVPVVHVPVPVEAPLPPPLNPGELGWPTDAFTFYFSWDYNSVFRRKNPLGLIEAFTRAFGPQDGAALVLKCINGDRDPANHEMLMRAIADRPDIVLIDEYVSARDKDRMMATCDCYVSLHRSEGLGLTMAEAMLFGKPLIATNYSGNTDFMSVDNSYPVDFEMTPVGPGSAPYAPDSEWAEPDVAQAANLMREVFDHPDAAAERAERGAGTIRDHYSSRAVGAAMQARLERLREGSTPVHVPSPLPPIDRGLEPLIARGTTPRAPSNFGKPGAALRKLILRLIQPYTAYQADVNRGLLATAKRNDPVSQQLVADVARLQLTMAEDLGAVLSELRRQRVALDATIEAVSQETRTRQTEVSDLRRHTAGVDRLLQETHATPYMTSGVLSTFEEPGVGHVMGYRNAAANPPSDDEYREFEELFRGTEAFIRDRQRRYLPLLEGQGPVVDLGCGRGEMLDLLAEAQIPATGVDGDAGMVKRCIAKGHATTVHSDALTYLESVPDGSLGAIFSAQVIEHLPPDVLRRLIALARTKLRPGGSLIAETVNPHSVAALKTFWVDVTHQHPLFPEVVVAFCRIAGFGSAYAFYPNGSGDAERDRTTTGEYAVVATV